MNYKYFIIGIYLVFVALIMTMVFKSCGQSIELETQNYYAEELKFQDKIDAGNRGLVFRDSFKIVSNKGMIELQKPITAQWDSLRLEFKKPDNQKYDRSYSFLSGEKEQLSPSEFQEGYYNVSIVWYENGEASLIKKKIKLQ